MVSFIIRKNKRQGNIGIVLLGIFLIFTLTINSVLFIERKTVSIKRQNIHNAVVAANLASYYSIEQGNKDVLKYNPKVLKGYINNPDTIVRDGIDLNKIINISTSEYFKDGEKYKSIYLNQDEAYSYFSVYLKENLGLKENTGRSYSFIPISDSENKGDIKELNVISFDVYNAVYKGMKEVTVSNKLKEENRVYTGIHLELLATINHSAKYGSIGETANIPIHIDTEITLFRPIIK